MEDLAHQGEWCHIETAQEKPVIVIKNVAPTILRSQTVRILSVGYIDAIMQESLQCADIHAATTRVADRQRLAKWNCSLRGTWNETTFFTSVCHLD